MRVMIWGREMIILGWLECDIYVFFFIDLGVSGFKSNLWKFVKDLTDVTKKIKFNR